MCADLNRWGEEDKARYLAISLRGQAQRMLGNLTSNERTNYQILVRKLDERFGTEGQSELFMSRLLSKTKGQKESYQELADNIGYLVTKSYPTASEDMIRILTLQNFTDAIPNHELRTRIKLEKFKNVREAVMLACEIEAINQAEGGTRFKTKRPAVQEVKVVSPEASKATPTKEKSEKKKQTQTSSVNQVKTDEVKEINNALTNLTEKLTDMQNRMINLERTNHANSFRPSYPDRRFQRQDHFQPNYQSNFRPRYNRFENEQQYRPGPNQNNQNSNQNSMNRPVSSNVQERNPRENSQGSSANQGN